MALLPKQQRFVEEYIRDLDPTQAAIRAGYERERAREHGCRLLANSDVQDAIKIAAAEGAPRVEVTKDWVLRCLKGGG